MMFGKTRKEIEALPNNILHKSAWPEWTERTMVKISIFPKESLFYEDSFRIIAQHICYDRVDGDGTVYIGSDKSFEVTVFKVPEDHFPCTEPGKWHHLAGESSLCADGQCPCCRLRCCVAVYESSRSMYGHNHVGGDLPKTAKCGVL